MTEVDPLESAVMNLQFTVKEINTILNMIGNLPYVQSATLIAAIQNQCAPQIDALNAQAKNTDGVPTELEERN